jgi:hypothetical protein
MIDAGISNFWGFPPSARWVKALLYVRLYCKSACFTVKQVTGVILVPSPGYQLLTGRQAHSLPDTGDKFTEIEGFL